MSENNEIINRFVTAKKALFDKLYSFLNDRQREAVYTVNNPLLILAGAGSGKTTVLVHRIAFIIKYGNAYYENRPNITEDDVLRLERAAELSNDEIAGILSDYAVDPCPPWAMLAITFTNKAANEIKERLAKVIGDESVADEIWSGTFHSVCVRLLRMYGSAIGLDGKFTIYDTDDTKKLIAQCLNELNISDKILPVKLVMNMIGRAKDKLIGPDEFAAQAMSEKKDFRMINAGKVYQLYQKKLEASGAVDFDDIIRRTVILLQNSEDVRTHLQKRFRYVCIDEYQDTNHAQFVLASLLSGGRKNLMVVGDDDQSIYRFRGATIENILSFDRTYPDAKVIKLEQNYRSTQTILDAANAVIGNNVGRKGKKLWTEHNVGSAIELHRAANHNDEAAYIADSILKFCAGGKHRYSDVAVLYRMNAQSNAIERGLSRSGIAYRVIGGTRFYDRKEVKDILAYLQLIRNSDDDLRLRRIINEPKRKIGQTTISAVSDIAAAERTSMFTILENAEKYTALQKSVPALKSFAELIKELRRISETESLKVLFEKTIELSGYRYMLAAAGETEKDRLDNIDELVSNAIEYENAAENPTLDGFLEEVALVSDIDNYDKESDAVVLMTVHSAKGLEFPIVFLPGMEEGIFPGISAVTEKDELEEERRLAYVAITRAKENLVCTYAKERILFGKTLNNPISRFLAEIPKKLVNDTTKADYEFESRSYSGSHSGSYSDGGTKSGGTKNSFKKNVYDTIHEKTVFDEKPVKQTEIFKVGETVVHSAFGSGVVLSVKPMSADTLYEIAFDKVGTKKMMATYAKLKKG